MAKTRLRGQRHQRFPRKMSRPNYTAAYMTGHSIPGCAGLSFSQRQFQAQSPIPIELWQAWNFPYHPTEAFPESYPLLAASWNNLMHFLTAQRRCFPRLYRDAVVECFSEYRKIILIAYSCGFELLRQLDLPPNLLSRIHVFACGPVSFGRPLVASLCIVQGKQDIFSRLFHRRVDYRCACGHLNYLESAETMRHFQAFCAEVLS